MNIAFIIIAVFFVAALLLGMLARFGKNMDLEQWTVGGRGLGSALVFLLLAGEIYTTFTFLGGASWAYGKGGPAMFILAYGSLGYVLSYWLLPPIWRYAKQQGLVSQSDFFVSKYDSPWLGILVSVVGIVAMIPYLVLQFKGLKLIMEVTSYGAIDGTVAVWLGAAGVTLYVIVSGLHGSAWTSVLKDAMMLLVVVFLGIYLPLHFYGGYGSMFHQIDQMKPQFLLLTGSKNVVWFISTVSLTLLGYYMWPHTFGSVYSGRHARVFRRNATFLPLYQLVILFVFFVGFAAIAQIPHLDDDDMALLQLSLNTFPHWFVGIIGAAGLLAALVPGSMLMMATATAASRNIYQALNQRASDARVVSLARLLVPVVALVAVYFTLAGGQGIVTLLLLGYSFVTQLFPSLLLSLFPRHFGTKQGAAAGIIVGVAAVAYIKLAGVAVTDLMPFLPTGFKDINAGIVALILNAVVLIVVSLLTGGMRRNRASAATRA